MTKEEFLRKKNKLVEQQKVAEANYHRICGAISFIDEQLATINQEEVNAKSDAVQR